MFYSRWEFISAMRSLNDASFSKETKSKIASELYDRMIIYLSKV